MAAEIPRNETIWVFLIDTDSYAGNFERELCAYLTGHVGDCEVGKKDARLFVEDIGDPEEYFPNIKKMPDDNGCYRPASIWETDGKFQKIEHQGKTLNNILYNSVAVFFNEKPTAYQILLMKDRAGKEFQVKHGRKPVKIKGFRLLEVEVKITEKEYAI